MMRCPRFHPSGRALALALCLQLAAPPAAYALRRQSAQESGLEEGLTNALGTPDGEGAMVPPDLFARLLDHTNLGDPAKTNKEDIQRTAREAVQLGASLVAVRPGEPTLWAAEVLAASPTGVKVGPAVGFRLLSQKYDKKMDQGEALALYEIPLAEKRREITETVQALRTRFPNVGFEIDFVINVHRLAVGQTPYVRDEIEKLIKQIRSLERPGEHIVVKVIGENYWLKRLGKQSRQDLMSMVYGWAKEFGADFVKSSTGFAPEGAVASDIRRMREIVGPTMGIKAAGGVRTGEDAEKMIQAAGLREVTPAAFRIGTSAGVDLSQDYRERWQESLSLSTTWRSLLETALERWKGRGWIPNPQVLSQELLNAGGRIEKQLEGKDTNGVWRRRMATLQGLSLLAQALSFENPPQSAARIAYLLPSPTNPEAILHLSGGDTDYRFRLVFRMVNEPLVTIGVYQVTSSGAVAKVGTVRLGLDRKSGPLHLDLADSDEQTHAWAHRIPVERAWGPFDKPQEALDRFQAFLGGLYEYLVNLPTDPSLAGLEERTPGKDPADPDVEVRAGVVRQVMETRGLSPGSAVVLARFLAGEMDFDQGREELVEASTQNPPALDGDQARTLLLQVWILARHRLDYALSEDMVEAAGNRFLWTTAWFDFLSRTPGMTSIDQARPVLDDIRRLADLAGIAQMDPMARQFSGLVKRVRDGITQEDWEAVVRALAPQPGFSPPMNLGVFALLAAPGEEQLAPAQLDALAGAVIWSLDQRLLFGVEVPPIDAELLGPALRSVVMDVLTEPVSEEVAEAALLGGESNIGIANLAAMGAIVLAEALYRALPADESSELTQLYLPVAARLQELAWYFAREPYREGTTLKQLWMQSEMELYFSKSLPEGEAITEISRIALGRRFRKMVFEDKRDQVVAEFALPMDPTVSDQAVTENVRRLTAESNVEPRGVSLLAVLARGGPPVLVVRALDLPPEPVAVQATLIPPVAKNPFPVAEPQGPLAQRPAQEEAPPRAPAQQREVFVTDFLKVYYRSAEAAEQTTGALLRGLGGLGGPERLPGFERQDVDLIPLEAEQDPEPYSILVRTADEILPAELEQRWRQNHVALITVSSEMTLAQLIREALAQWTGRPVGEVLEIRHRDGLVGIFA